MSGIKVAKGSSSGSAEPMPYDGVKAGKVKGSRRLEGIIEQLTRKLCPGYFSEFQFRSRPSRIDALELVSMDFRLIKGERA